MYFFYIVETLIILRILLIKKINDLINKNDRKNNNMIFHVEDENISSINSRYSSFIQDNFQENLLGSEEGINKNGNRIIIKRIFTVN